ncbi:MAG TPA: polyprenyl synthetase family protein [Cytophagales bacterium]|nr:polyprenyl synthetase family protein [Cytophagales bacterium]
MSFDYSRILSRINEEISTISFGENPVELYDPINYIMNLGGKRLRPLLAVFGYYLFDDEINKVLRPSIAVEVFHNFTLMHDDIMDKAPLRRGKPTVHEKWNSNIAILSGDVMLVKAYDFLLEVEGNYFKEVTTKFNKCASQVCEGQQLDMNYQYLPSISETSYLEMIRLKTAVLLGFSLEMGGMLAGASSQDLAYLRSFGENIGVGFQLKDDLLDVYANKDKFGKQVGGDILENKKTFLLINALENANISQAKTLSKWLSASGFDPEEKVKEVTGIFDELKIKEITQLKMSEYFNKAFNDLEKVNASADKKLELRKFAETLIEREQ